MILKSGMMMILTYYKMYKNSIKSHTKEDCKGSLFCLGASVSGRTLMPFPIKNQIGQERIWQIRKLRKKSIEVKR